MADRIDLSLWVDLETTGLKDDDPRIGVLNQRILEVGFAITTAELDPLPGQDSVRFRSAVVTPDADTLEALDRAVSYVIDMHTESGLLDAVQLAYEGDGTRDGVEDHARLGQVESAILHHLDRARALYPADAKVLFKLAGSNVPYDRSFLDAFMPRVIGAISYNNYDVSALRTHHNLVMDIPADLRYDNTAGGTHRALDDIRDHYREAVHYRMIDALGLQGARQALSDLNYEELDADDRIAAMQRITNAALGVVRAEGVTPTPVDR